jgi:hypothetical protein
MPADNDLEAAWEDYRRKTPGLAAPMNPDDEMSQITYHARLWNSYTAFLAGWEAALPPTSGETDDDRWCHPHCHERCES